MSSREIKFRAWDKRRNSWFKDFWVDMLGGIYGIGDLPNNIFDEEKSYIPDHIEVNQYTGKKDKNDLEIYEEDIIMDEAGFKGVVFYSEDHAQFLIDFGYGIDLQEIGTWAEKVGNKFENPELLV